MRRLGSMLVAAVITALGNLAVAQEPEAELETGKATGAIIAPRTDLYSTYSEAFMNPDSLAGYGCETAGEMNRTLRAPRHYKVIFSYDQIRWGRTKAGNEELLRTSPNIFDQATGGGPLVTGDPDGLPLYGFPLDSSPTQSGLIAVDNPNVAGIGQVFFPGDDPNSDLIGTQFTNSRPIGEFLVANQLRMQTDDFSHGREYGYRPKIGIEFNDESKLTVSYFKVEDFEARMIQDVSGASFLTRVISDEGSPFLPQYQRFGYLNSNFITALATFGGERRRQIGDDPSPIPHDPNLESPPVYIQSEDFATSSDAPREPTVNDPGRLGVLNGPEDTNVSSLLWTDGEVAIADYNYDIQGGEILFEKSLFEWFNPDWKIWALGGLKYLAMDEGFTFTFADIAPPGGIGNTGYQARSPLDRFTANQVNQPVGVTNFKAQPSVETVAITNFSVDNDIIAPEIGIHAVRPVWGVFEFDLKGTGAFGPNFMTKDSYLIRGDGLVGFIRNRSETATSGVLECQLGMNFVPHPNVRLRIGWEAMYMLSVATAVENIEFNLDIDRRPSNNDSVLFHGWYFGGEITF